MSLILLIYVDSIVYSPEIIYAYAHVCMCVCVHVCVYVCAGVCVPSVRGRFADRACTWVVVMRVAASLCRCVYNGP